MEGSGAAVKGRECWIGGKNCPLAERLLEFLHPQVVCMYVSTTISDDQASEVDLVSSVVQEAIQRGSNFNLLTCLVLALFMCKGYPW